MIGSESFEKIHKKQKLNPEKDIDDLHLPSEERLNSHEDGIHDFFLMFSNVIFVENQDWQVKALNKVSMHQRAGLEIPASMMDKEKEDKKDGKKPGLYRFLNKINVTEIKNMVLR